MRKLLKKGKGWAKGIKLTDEHKNKIALGHKGKKKTPMTEEARLSIGRSVRGRKMSDFPELRFAIDNGRTLCEKCHRNTDTYAKHSICKKN